MGERLRRAMAAGGVLLALSGAAAAGDFGRGEPTSVEPKPGQFNDTDEEREMHDRIWRFMRPPHEFRIDKKLGRASYYMWLSRTAYASSRTRYGTIDDDAEADLGTLPDTFAAICRVEDVDRQRQIALNGLPGLEPGMATGVADRDRQNTDEIYRFAGALRWRFEAYSYALDHLLVETPHEEAVAVDGRLGELEHYVRRAERGDFCDHAVVEPPRSRYEDAAAPVDLELPGS